MFANDFVFVNEKKMKPQTTCTNKYRSSQRNQGPNTNITSSLSHRLTSIENQGYYIYPLLSRKTKNIRIHYRPLQ